MRAKQDHPDTGQGNGTDEKYLHPAECVLNPDPSPKETAMDNSNNSHQSHRQGFVLELCWYHIKSEESILGEYDAVAGRETQNNCLHCDQGRRKEPRTRIGILQVYLDSLSLACLLQGRWNYLFSS